MKSFAVVRQIVLYLTFTFLFISFFSTDILADNKLNQQDVQGTSTNVSASSGMASGGQIQPNLFTGSFGYQVPIVTPPGRNGIQPNLVLTYSSNNGESWVGKGWQLTMGYIEIDTRFGVPKYDGTDIYKFVLNGQSNDLQRFGSSSCGTGQCPTYRARYEGTYLLFTQVTLFNAEWIATDGKGREYFFGGPDANALERDPSNPLHVAKWYLTKVKDQYGNVMRITYVKSSGGKSYISDINYTGLEDNNGNIIEPGATDIHFYTSSSYEPYSNTSGMDGFLITSNELLESIVIQQNNRLIRSYSMVYDFGTNGAPLLSMLTQTGSDGISALPPTTFGYSNYYQNTGAGLKNLFVPGNSNFANFDGNIVWSGMDDGRRFIDVNGDGLPDLLIGKTFYDNTDSYFKAYINNGDGWTQDNSWSPQYPDGFFLPFIVSPYNNGVFFGDINGDGKLDILQSCSPQGGLQAGMMFFYCRTGVWLNNGNGFSYSPAWSSALSSTTTLVSGGSVQSYEMDYGTVIDVNGDGRTDIVNWHTGQVFINNGSGWTLDSTWSSGLPSEIASWNDIRFVDVNGDGLPDIIASPNVSDQTKKVYINNGHGWSYSNEYTSDLDGVLYYLANIAPNRDSDLSGVTFVDINNDGKTDVVDLISKQVFLGGETGWFYWWGSEADSVWSYSLSNINSLYNGGIFLDLDGDGTVDALYANQDNKYVYMNIAQPSDLLSSISNGVGGSISINYSVYKATSNMPFALPVVSSVTTNNGIEPTATTYYFPFGGKYDGTLKQFDGFSQAWTIYPDGHSDITYFYQNDPYRGKIYKIETYAHLWPVPFGPIDLTKSISTTWSSQTVNGSQGTINIIYPSEQDEYDSFDNSDNPITPYKFIKQSVDDYGDTTDIYQGGTGVSTRHTHINYASSSDGTVVGLPDEISIQDSNGTYYKDTLFFYDSLGFGQVSTGSLTQQASWLNNTPSNSLSQGTYIITRYSYDSYGNIVSLTDANGNTTTISYDSATHTYPYIITNPLGQSIKTTYDTGFGVPIESTDVNGVEKQNSYDVFGRLTTESIYINGTHVPLNTYSYNLNTFPSSVIKNSYEIAGSNDHLTEVEFFDGFGRSLEKKQSAGTSDIVESATLYNKMGQPETQYLPYSEPSTNLYTYTTPSGASTGTKYDALGRPTEIDYPDGRWIDFNYNNGSWNINLTDSSGKQVSRSYDAFGNVIGVSGSNGSASYSYDLMNKLVGVTDQQGNTTVTSYDTLGRKILTNSPDMGVWNYAYDSNGNIITQIDGNGKETYFHYDALNRMIIEEDPHLISSPPGQRKKLDGSFTVPKPCNPAHACVGSDPIIYYNYDEPSSTDGIGRLTSITDTVAVTHYGYDVFGNVISEAKLINIIGQSFTITRSYDLLGRLNSITYPDTEQVGYYYGDDGRLKQVIGNSNYVTDIEYNPTGEMAQMTLGNGIVENYSYDPNNLRLTGIDAGGAGNTVLSQSYTYTQDGNISAIADNINNTYSQTFSYDNTSRLIQAIGAYGTKQYAYGPTGNLIQKDGVSYTYSTTQPEAVIAGSNGFTASYDTDGQMTSMYDPTKATTYNYTYDFEGHLTNISSGNGPVTAQYYYDGTGQRIAKVVGKDSTIYIDKLYEIRSTYTAKHIYALGKIIASIVNTSTGTSPSSFNPHPGGPLPPGTNVPNSHGKGWGCGLWKGGISTGNDNDKQNPIPDMLMLMLPLLVLMVIKLRRATGKLQGIYKGIISSVIPSASGGMRNPVLNASLAAQTYRKKHSISFKEIFRLSPHPLRNVLYIVLAVSMFITAPPFTRTLQASWRDHNMYIGTMDPVYYYIYDMLGSTQVVTDASGNIVTTVRYDPFGSVFQLQQASGEYQTPYLYTGQELDSESGLYYYNARYYNPVIGRFTSADPVVIDPLTPQSLNRYSYVLNNPLRYTDPAGLSWLSQNWTYIVAGLIVAGTIAADVVTEGALTPTLIGELAGAFVGGSSAAENGGDVGMGILVGVVVGGIAGAIGGEILPVVPLF